MKQKQPLCGTQSDHTLAFFPKKVDGLNLITATPPHSGAIIGGRGYFSSGGDFDLKTTFYGLVLLNMTERQLPEVSADIKTISVRPEIRSGRPFKVYAHYLFLSTV